MFSARAPGSIMLLGEHAILRQPPAISCAIDRYITVQLIPRKDDTITIQSAILGQHKTTLDKLSTQKPFTFVLATLQQANLTSGCDIVIESDFSDKVGLGSSAAVTVALLKSLAQWHNKTLSKKTLLQSALHIIRSVQTIGSGADAAASVYGGIIAYDPFSLRVECLPYKPDITLIYCGYKTPTPDVVNKVNAAYEKNPHYCQTLFDAITQCAKQGIDYIKQQNWEQLGNTFLQQQQILSALNLSDAVIDELISQAFTFPKILGAKISGSGLGDCIVTLGKLPPHSFPQNKKQKASGVKQLDISISDLHYE